MIQGPCTERGSCILRELQKFQLIKTEKYKEWPNLQSIFTGQRISMKGCHGSEVVQKVKTQKRKHKRKHKNGPKPTDWQRTYEGKELELDTNQMGIIHYLRVPRSTKEKVCTKKVQITVTI